MKHHKCIAAVLLLFAWPAVGQNPTYPDLSGYWELRYDSENGGGEGVCEADPV